MSGTRISGLPAFTPQGTDLVALSRPGAPNTNGRASLNDIAFLRGTIDVARWPGVTRGATLAGDTGIRTATRTAFQAAIQAALDQNKFLEVPPGQYDIQGAELHIPLSERFTWKGSKASEVVQWGMNMPVLRIGSQTADYTAGLWLEGFRLRYNTDQANISRATNAGSASGATTLSFASTTGILVGMVVTGTNVPAEQAAPPIPPTTVVAVAGSVVTLSAALTGTVANGATITFLHSRSSALRIGFLRNSVIEQGNVFAVYNASGPTVRAYRAVQVASDAASDNGFFSNTVRDLEVAGAVHNLLDMSLFGTGSVWSNIYRKQGNLDLPIALTGSALNLVAPFSSQDGGVFEQLNIEWVAGNRICTLQNLRNVTFLSGHWEGCRLTGFDPALMNIASSDINFDGCKVVSLYCQSADVTGGNAAVFQTWGDNRITLKGFDIKWQDQRVNRALALFSPSDSSPPSATPIYSASDVRVDDDNHGGNIAQMSLDHRLPRATYGMPRRIGSYTAGPTISETVGARFDQSASGTLYAAHGRAMHIYPARLAGDTFVTLARTRLAPGVMGGRLPPALGERIIVRRDSGASPTFSLYVFDHQGRFLAEIAPAAVTSNPVTLTFVWNGTGWVNAATYTPGLARIAGTWRAARSPVAVTTSAILLPDTIYATLARLDGDGQLIDAMGIRIIAGGSAGSAVKFALYAAANDTNPAGMPLLAQTGNAAATAPGDAVGVFTGGALAPGPFFWFATKWTGGGGAMPTTTTINEPSSEIPADSVSEALSFTSASLKGFSVGSQPFADPFPAAFPAAPTKVVSTTMPIGAMRFA